ncbi:mechanosensitive ion channel family protein [Inquilinus limosus]|uniref:hypothetical protein n=1 Tax=Inquilinus limosus TaxID=171674 RepID=UPI003F190A30
MMSCSCNAENWSSSTRIRFVIRPAQGPGGPRRQLDAAETAGGAWFRGGPVAQSIGFDIVQPFPSGSRQGSAIIGYEAEEAGALKFLLTGFAGGFRRSELAGSGLTWDTDVERVRKIVKAIGQELAADPVHGPKFLDPLKSQGVIETDDSAMIVRVKFMTRPGDQFILRRLVYARIKGAFAEAGIRFASREVVVRLAGDGAVPSEASSLPSERSRRRSLEAPIEACCDLIVARLRSGNTLLHWRRVTIDHSKPRPDR